MTKEKKVPQRIAKHRKKYNFNDDFENAEDCFKYVKEFFEMFEKEQWNLARMCTYLNISKDKWRHLPDKGDDYKLVREYASQHLEMKYLDNLDKPACTGAIFALKNMGYSDKQDVETTLKGNLTVEQLLKGTNIKA